MGDLWLLKNVSNDLQSPTIGRSAAHCGVGWSGSERARDSAISRRNSRIDLCPLHFPFPTRLPVPGVHSKDVVALAASSLDSSPFYHIPSPIPLQSMTIPSINDVNPVIDGRLYIGR